MKKRAVSVMLTAAMVSAMLAGCGSKNAETQSAADTTAESAVSGDETSADTQAADAETTDASKTDGTFTVGFDQDFPPMGFVGDDGEFTGFDLEMAAEVAKRLNLTIAYQPIAWDAKDMELDAGTIDCIWNGFTMNGREDDYEWSKPYMKNNQVFVVRGDSDINSEADLAGKNVEVQTDSSAEAALNDNSELTSTFGSLTPVADYNTAFMDLESGAVDAIAMDDVVASYQITSRKADFKVLDDVIAAEEYGIGFKKGNTGLRDKVQATLEEMAADGTAAKDFREVVRKRHHNDPVNQTENKRRAVASAAALFMRTTNQSVFLMVLRKERRSYYGYQPDAYEAGRGYGDVLLDFRDHTAFFPATRYGHSVWTNVKKTYCSGDYKNLYFNHARHTADAAADGCLFRTVLSVRDQNFTVLPKHCGGDRFCA